MTVVCSICVVYFMACKDMTIVCSIRVVYIMACKDEHDHSVFYMCCIHYGMEISKGNLLYCTISEY